MEIHQYIKHQIIDAGKKLYQTGFAPATSGNYSMRLEDGNIAITVSGADKGQLTEQDIIAVDINGKVLNSVKKSSAETLLHTSLYELYPDIGAILHVHSVCSTVLSRLYKDKPQLELKNYELQKVFPNITTHESTLSIPLFANTQDMQQLAQQVKNTLPNYSNAPGYLIVGHGSYVWGATMQDTLRHVEALEFLLNCELETLKVSNRV